MDFDLMMLCTYETAQEQVCIDAQARLREKEGKENCLGIEKTRQYLVNAAKMLL